MLSDEEKTALELIKINNKHKYCDKDDVDFLLNLIEKQSKEIEELKENNKTLKNLQNDTNRLYIEMIERKNYFERELQKVVDKIKAKIEEVEQWELYNMKIPKLSTLDERLGAKIGIKYVLQSLLEKE